MSAYQSDSPTWIDQRIGNYRLVRLLGHGGMGMVFEGVHDGVGGRAAIKVLRREVASRTDIAARFFNEARAANAIQHPGIVRIFDCGYTEQGIAFLVMEFLEGESLRARLDRVQRLPVPHALRLARQLASALVAAHQKNVIHRDLKPDNVMLVRDPDLPGGERVKLLDFGIAKMAESLGAVAMNTRSDLLMGTPTYMAPEQCRGAKSVTDRSDVYSLGIVIYQVLAGRTPFLGETVGELIAMHLMDAPLSLQEAAPHVPPAVASLIHAMLQKQPQLRPSMESVLQQLQRMEAETEQRPAPRAADPNATIPMAPSLFPELSKANAEAQRAQEPEPPRRRLSTVTDAASESLRPRRSLWRFWLLGIVGGGACVLLGARLLSPKKAVPHAPAEEHAAFPLADLMPRSEPAVLPAEPVREQASTPAPTQTQPLPSSIPSRQPRAAAEPAAASNTEGNPPPPRPTDRAPAPVPVKSAVSQNNLESIRKSIQESRLSDALQEAAGCGREYAAQCYLVSGIAICKYQSKSLNQELVLALKKSPYVKSVELIEEIEEECGFPVQAKNAQKDPLDASEPLNSAEKYLRDGYFRKAMDITTHFGKSSPARAWEIFGRAACGLRETTKANEAVQNLQQKGELARLQELITYCKKYDYVFGDGKLY
jgi:serine/threonine protein kinase